MTMGRLFQRRREDFVCDQCGYDVTGDGYTNHCPRCLWSKHVDVMPGDRQERCRGMMSPERLEASGGGYRIIHRCTRCGSGRRVRTAPADDMEALIRLVGVIGRKRR